MVWFVWVGWVFGRKEGLTVFWGGEARPNYLGARGVAPLPPRVIWP
jgi:hypothetical protein